MIEFSFVVLLWALVTFAVALICAGIIALFRALFPVIILLAISQVGSGQPPALTPIAGQRPSPEVVALGRALFFDPRLSVDRSVSCATCHNPDKGYQDGLRTARGVGGQLGTVNTPTILLAAYSTRQFWDGRTIGSRRNGQDLANSMQVQALQPITNPVEMAFQNEGQMLRRVASIQGYGTLFRAAFGPTARISRENVGFALAAFEQAIIPDFNAPIDRRMAGDFSALNEQEERGLQVMIRAKCFDCHTPPLYIDRGFHNNGAEFATKFRVTDNGRFDVTRRRQDVRAFKTPSLRDVAITGPYFHSGNADSLERVVRHYSSGGARFDGVRDTAADSRIFPGMIRPEDEADVAACLRGAFTSPSQPRITAPALPQ